MLLIIVIRRSLLKVVLFLTDYGRMHTWHVMTGLLIMPTSTATVMPTTAVIHPACVRHGHRFYVGGSWCSATTYLFGIANYGVIPKSIHYKYKSTNIEMNPLWCGQSGSPPTFEWRKTRGNVQAHPAETVE